LINAACFSISKEGVERPRSRTVIILAVRAIPLKKAKLGKNRSTAYTSIQGAF